MLTLPTPSPYRPTLIDHRVARELDRAGRELLEARDRGAWPKCGEMRAVIEVLRRIQRPAPP